MRVPSRVFRDLVDLTARSGAIAAKDEDRAAIVNAMRDAFEGGDVGAVRQALVQHATSPKAAATLGGLVESALASLGVDATKARQTWKRELAKAATSSADPTPPSPRHSPARDAFLGVRMPTNAETATALRRISAREARVDAGIAAALADPKPVEALRAVAAAMELSDASDHALMSLIAGFARFEAWSDLLAVFHAAPAEFRSYSLPQRAAALALIQTQAVDEARGLLEKMGVAKEDDNVLWGLLGKVYTRKWEEDPKAKDAHVWLERAAKAYSSGFEVARSELYPGICVPIALELLGDLSSRGRAIETADTMLRVALQRVSYGERQYWDHAAVLMMAVVKNDGELFESFLGRLAGCKTEPWMFTSTIDQLSRLATVRADRGESTVLVDRALEELLARRELARAKTGEALGAPHDDSARPMLGALLDHAYRFGGRSSKRLAGNYHLDGIAHDVRVTPADIVYFTRIITGAKIDAIDDPRKASAAMDALIRGHFGTAALEDLSGPAHQRFDAVMPKLARYMGAQASNSQTNVSADWINGLADCRQHAPVKLMMFEAWKRLRTERTMGEVDAAVAARDPDKLAALDAELSHLASWEMRILDAEIVNQATGSTIEEHTLTLLIRRKPTALGEEMSELEEVHLADSFYHDVYKLGRGTVEASMSAGGRLWIPVPARAKDGTEIALAPTLYSYDRARPSVDFGQLKFRGIQVASPGWEQMVPIDGLDLDYLHRFVAGLS